MSLTNTNREVPRPERAGGLRDLRFAGTVAAGLVAGVLGVGALSAPLLGWTDWPDKLQPGADNSPVTMSSPEQRQAVAQPPRSGSRTPAGPSAGTTLGSGARAALLGCAQPFVLRRATLTRFTPVTPSLHDAKPAPTDQRHQTPICRTTRNAQHAARLPRA